MTSDLERPDPYLAPVAGAVRDGDPQRIRERFLTKEALLRAVGISYSITGLFSAIRVGKTAMLVPEVGAELWRVVGLLSLLTLIYLASGAGLLFLRSAARLLALLLSAFFILMDLSFILGALPALADGSDPAAFQSILLTFVDLLVPAIGLGLLVTRGGRFVLSAEYRSVVAATPQISFWRTPAMIAGLILVIVDKIAAFI